VPVATKEKPLVGLSDVPGAVTCIEPLGSWVTVHLR